MMQDSDVCYEPAPRVVAAAENLAVSHGYQARDLNWSQVHWNYRARRLMEAAYHRACAERGDGPEMLPAWRDLERRMRAAYEPSTSHESV